MILFPNGIQGLSDTKWSGVRGSAYRLVGVDYRSEPGAIKAHQKLSKISPASGGNIVDQLCKVGLPISDGSTIWFSSISGKIWREVDDTFTLLGTLTMPGYTYNLESMEDTGNFVVPSEDAQIMSIFFKPDGLTMFLLGFSSDDVFQYTLSTAFDISTAVYATKSFSASTEDTAPRGMFVKSDGTKVYLAGDTNNTIYQYTLSTPWDASTGTYDTVSISVAGQTTDVRNIFMKSDGTKLYLVSTTTVFSYTLSTPWDLSTMTYDLVSFSLTSQTSAASGISFTDDGSLMFISGGEVIYKYALSTPFDLSTASYATDSYDASATTAGNILGIWTAEQGSGETYIYASTVNSGGVFQFLMTDRAEDLNVTVLGAAEFAVPDGADGPDEDELDDEMTQYVYFATKNWLLRIAVSNIVNIHDPAHHEQLTLFKYGDDTYHPAKIANNRLFFGDKYTILQVDEFGVITLESDLSVREPERITILHNFDVDLLVGTKTLDEKSRILRWDTESETWYGEDIIYEGEIHAFLDEDNYTYAIVGDFGNFHYYDGEKLLKHIRIPGSYSSTAKCKVNANSVGYFMGVPIFGVSNIAGNPTLQGVYSYGQYSKDYSITMDLSFPISSGEFAGLELGAIIVQGTDVYVAWKSGTAVGIDKLDWSNKYNGAYIETMVLNNAEDRSKFKAFDKALADYIEMPADTAVVMAYSKNYAAYQNMVQVDDTKLMQLRSKETIPEIGAMQLKFTFTCVANTTPKIENFHGDFQGEE